MHLLQILGGQTWPNLLPILALKPEKITFLSSLDQKSNYAESAKCIQQAAHEIGLYFEYDIVKTTSDTPSIYECSKAIAPVNPDSINITGGTKLMSIAAYLHAKQLQRPSFYIDTRRGSDAFEITSEGTQGITFPNLDHLAEKITVRIALMSQGFAVPKSFTSPDKNDQNFALIAAKIRQDSGADREIGRYLNSLRKQFICPVQNQFFKKGKLRTALRKSFSVEAESAIFQYLLAAEEHGLVTRLETGVDFTLTTLDVENTDSKTLRSITNHHFKLLEGVWFELALLSYLEEQPQFSDICWSVEAESDNAASIGETDLVAFNKDTFTLHFISCKTVAPHGQALDHIQGLRRRATKEGGKFSKADLWIFAPKSADSKKNLLKHCKEQDVTLHILSEIMTF